MEILERPQQCARCAKSLPLAAILAVVTAAVRLASSDGRGDCGVPGAVGGALLSLSWLLPPVWWGLLPLEVPFFKL